MVKKYQEDAPEGSIYDVTGAVALRKRCRQMLGTCSRIIGGHTPNISSCALVYIAAGAGRIVYDDCTTSLC